MRLDVPNYLFVDNHCVDPGDPELGTWSKEQLVEMDARFVAALERVFACGLENKRSAAAQARGGNAPKPVVLRAMRQGRRWRLRWPRGRRLSWPRRQHGDAERSEFSLC